MGFSWWAEEQRVRINLSEQASLVLEEDMYQFEVKERSAFMNTVFRNYHQNAPASVSLYLQTRRSEMIDQFSEIISGEEEREHIISALLDNEEKGLLDQIRQEQKLRCQSNSYRINNENLQFLTSEECGESEYYDDRPSLYIKCILEEYSRLPFIERERIFFADSYAAVEDAIKTHSLLKVRTKGNKLFHVYPFSLETDSLSTRLYLTGFSKRISEGSSEKIPASFRIPRLTSITCLRQSGRLTADEAAEIKQAIRSKSVQFLLSDEDTIRVRLTDEGIRKYNNQLYLRPTKDPELSSGYEYVFHCTSQQAEYYFFKFGKDAEIIAPPFLRSKFIEAYKNAAYIYNPH